MLENIKGIDDLKQLDIDSLPILCEEIRTKLVDTVLMNGGHLASNLGVVELTVALRYVFDEEDKIVWDVGHQCYVDKILTGRYDDFDTIRTGGGLSGFPTTCEGDCFGTGHASTAISASLGLATARDIAGENYNVVAVVGDGSMTGGLTYEALNNIKNTKMLVILNDNNMSIAETVGTANLNMSKLRVGKYDKRKEQLKKFLNKIPLVGKPIYKFLRFLKRKAKLKFVRNSYFDNFNLKYVGIIDGNEIKDLVYYLRKIKENVDTPTVLHIVTKKGKGYEPAEQNPEKYHNVTFDNDNLTKNVVGDELCNLAESNSKVCAITAAMQDGVGLNNFAEKFKDRFFDVGIAEEHAVTFSAGLAKGGMRPFVCVYSTFLQRAYDQIIHDVALQNLPVTFLIDRTGLVGCDGATHQGIETLSYLTGIPSLTVLTPSNYLQLRTMMQYSLTLNSPVAICYGKTLNEDGCQFNNGWNVIKQGKVTLLAVGSKMLNVAMSVGEKLDVGIVDVTSVKPLDESVLNNLSGTVITMEENQLDGGFGSAVARQFGNKLEVITLGVDNKYVCHNSVDNQLKECGLDVESVKNIVEKYL